MAVDVKRPSRTIAAHAKLLENDGDVPRNQEGIALVGDPRNDVHVFMSQMQVAFIRAHNRLVDRSRAAGMAESDVFDEARRVLTWHYQWVIVSEFLPGLAGRELVDETLDNGPRHYRPGPQPYIPDPESYLALDPSWTPTLPGRSGRARLRDILVPA